MCRCKPTTRVGAVYSHINTLFRLVQLVFFLQGLRAFLAGMLDLGIQAIAECCQRHKQGVSLPGLSQNLTPF